MELNGVYKSCPKYGPQNYPEERNVCIRDGRVQLITDRKTITGLGPFVFSYNCFFDVNNLGERVGDIPNNFVFGVPYDTSNVS